MIYHIHNFEIDSQDLIFDFLYEGRLIDPFSIVKINVEFKKDNNMVTNSYFRNKNYCISLKGIISYKYYNGCLDVIADSYNAIKSSFSNFAVTPLVAYYGGVVLHASGVILKRKEKAVLFMGVCGAGKTTLSQYLSFTHSDEYTLLSDDAVTVFVKEGRLFAGVGPTVSKLTEDTINFLNIKENEGSTYDNRKLFVRSDHKVSKDCYEIEKVFFISPAREDDFSSTLLSQEIQLPYLMSNLVSSRFFDDTLLSVLYNNVSKVSPHIESRLLRIPRKLSALNNELAEFIGE